MKTKSKILVVDDKGINRYMLGSIFQDAYEVIEVSGGQEAIEVIAKEAENFAVVLLDIIMPVIDGFGVLEYMRIKELWTDCRW